MQKQFAFIQPEESVQEEELKGFNGIAGAFDRKREKGYFVILL